MRVCQTCGSRYNPELLVECSKCHAISEHTYCLINLEETDDGEVIWACEFCEPRFIELSDSPSRVSDTETIEPIAELQDDVVKPLCLLISEDAQSIKNAEAGPSTEGLKSFYRDLERSHNLKRQMHNNFVGDKHLPDEDSEATRVKASESGSPETSSFLEDDFCSTIEPLPAPIWKGSFQIYGEHSCTVMMAHLSNEACIEASEVASSLPEFLRLEMVSKINIWPMKFKKMGPTLLNIAVYFFPVDRTERVYDCLVEDMIDHEFAMISRINNVELLIFSSCELPPNNWRLKRKYYLWGMFRRKKRILPQNQSDDCLSSRQGNFDHTLPSNLSTETCAMETKLNT